MVQKAIRKGQIEKGWRLPQCAAFKTPGEQTDELQETSQGVQFIEKLSKLSFKETDSTVNGRSVGAVAQSKSILRFLTNIPRLS